MALKKNFFKLKNNAIFGKKEYVRKHRDIKLVTTERRNYLVSEPNYHSTKFFTENLLTMEMKRKTQILMNKLVYLGLWILALSKTLMYEFYFPFIFHFLHFFFFKIIHINYRHNSRFIKVAPLSLFWFLPFYFLIPCLSVL